MGEEPPLWTRAGARSPKPGMVVAGRSYGAAPRAVYRPPHSRRRADAQACRAAGRSEYAFGNACGIAQEVSARLAGGGGSTITRATLPHPHEDPEAGANLHALSQLVQGATRARVVGSAAPRLIAKAPTVDDRDTCNRPARALLLLASTSTPS